MTQPFEVLPLRPVEFQVLLSLSRGPLHGYGIIQDAENRGEGSAAPGLATLYRALSRMEKDGWIVRSDGDRTSAEDERRRPFRLTDLGRAIARAEADRLALLVNAAREADLLGKANGVG